MNVHWPHLRVDEVEHRLQRGVSPKPAAKESQAECGDKVVCSSTKRCRLLQRHPCKVPGTACSSAVAAATRTNLLRSPCYGKRKLGRCCEASHHMYKSVRQRTSAESASGQTYTHKGRILPEGNHSLSCNSSLQIDRKRTCAGSWCRWAAARARGRCLRRRRAARAPAAPPPPPAAAPRPPPPPLPPRPPPPAVPCRVRVARAVSAGNKTDWQTAIGAAVPWLH